jgi:hypothetical protein
MAEFINTIDVLGDDVVIDSIIDRTITEFKDNVIATVGRHAFYGCTALTEVDLPNITSIGSECFYGCSNLRVVDMPSLVEILGSYNPAFCRSGVERVRFENLTYMPQAIFADCTSLADVYAPKVTSISNNVFKGCSKLYTLDMPSLTSIAGQIAPYSALESLILRGSTICSIVGAGLLLTSIASGTGYIYVPRALVDSYKTAANWSTYAAQFRPLEDYTVDGTVTGALDESKI